MVAQVVIACPLVRDGQAFFCLPPSTSALTPTPRRDLMEVSRPVTQGT